MNKEDKQDMIDTLNDQMGYIMDLEKYMGTVSTPGLKLKDILYCNKLMMEIIDPPSHKLVKLFDKDEA
jgi:hypothetical protein